METMFVRTVNIFVAWYRSVVHNNVMQSMLSMLHAMKKLEIPFGDTDREVSEKTEYDNSSNQYQP